MSSPLRVLFIVGLTFSLVAAPAGAQQNDPRGQGQGQVIELTLDRMVELGLRDSYRVRQLLLGVERRRAYLQAELAEMKSRVDLEIATPEFAALSDEKWNPDLGRNEIVYTNTRLWQADLSVSQPVILFGYPTNGELSLNNRVYRYTQLDEDDDREVRYYNRYYVAYDQPLFQPNRMQNELEEAQLDLESAELDYMSDVIEVIDDLAEDHGRLIEAVYDGTVAEARVEDLEAAAAAAQQLTATDTTHQIEVEQLQVELANAREDVQQAASRVRLQTASIKQRLRLNSSDSLVVVSDLEITPVNVDLYQALHLATALAPRMRELQINRQRRLIDLEEERGRNSFRLDLELSYGREMQDPRLAELWGEPSNSYTVSLNGYIPIWDWGARRHRIRATEYTLQQAELQAEEARASIEVDVESEIRNLDEYVDRGISMQENLELARQLTATSIERYANGRVALADVLQSIEREAATARNFLQSYMGYRNALLRLQQLTHFDFVTGQPVVERFRAIELENEEN